MKKLLIIISIGLLMSSCSLKEAYENDLKTETDIKPFAPSETLAERYGDGKDVTFNIKIPLSEDSIGYYEMEEILGNERLDSDHKNFAQRLYDGLKLSFFDLMVKLGYSSRIKFSSVFNFPQINPKYLKSAKIKKVFFTTEDCREEDDHCNFIKDKDRSFQILDKLFVNLSIPSEDAPNETIMDSLDKQEFKNEVNHAFAKDNIQISEIETLKKADIKPINIVNFSNDIPYIDFTKFKLKSNGKEVHLSGIKGLKTISKYFSLDKFKPFVKESKYQRKRYQHKVPSAPKKSRVEVTLNDGVTLEKFIQALKEDRSPLMRKMVIFRLVDNFVEAKRYFQNEKFIKTIKDSTIIGRSIYVELLPGVDKDKFLSLVAEDAIKEESELNILRVEKCLGKNCLDLPVRNYNLVQVLQKSSKLSIDTFLSIRDLGNTDFKYNGFIEVELKLNLPL